MKLKSLISLVVIILASSWILYGAYSIYNNIKEGKSGIILVPHDGRPNLSHVEYKIEIPRVSFLVLSLSERPIRFHRNKYYWDVDGDNFAEATGWVRSSRDGLLAIDKNKDGIINNQSELFGSVAEDGFEMLSKYDANNDNVINSHDEIFDSLVVWIKPKRLDPKQDKISDKNLKHKIASLDELGVTSIDLNSKSMSYNEDYEGDLITHQSIFQKDGKEFNLYNVSILYSKFNTIYLGEYVLNDEVKSLPDLRGFGTLTDLHVAMSKDDLLVELVKDLSKHPDLLNPNFNLKQKVTNLMYRWASVDHIDPKSRGPNIDARKLSFLEKFMGEKYLQRGVEPNPLPGAASQLRRTFEGALAVTTSHLLIQIGVDFMFNEHAIYSKRLGKIQKDFAPDMIHYSSLYNPDEKAHMSGESNKEDFYIINTAHQDIKIRDHKGYDRIVVTVQENVELTSFKRDGDNLIISSENFKITVLDHFYNDKGLNPFRMEYIVFRNGEIVHINYVELDEEN